VDRRPSARRHARDVVQVLDSDRHAVQRPPRPARHRVCVARLRILERALGRHGRVALEDGIDLRDAVEDRLGELDRRDLARGDPVCGLVQ
jgi:hypothetical protein